MAISSTLSRDDSGCFLFENNLIIKNMKNETLPTCPICSATMEESRYKEITVCYHCLACEYATKNDFDRIMREEAIINGEFDNMYE